ncbi:MAG TPA: hypothetical protein VJ508_12375, partial [Saprospiraceae bacterium]|nr:hypothetical protein [Saprospiraceae bacterium]
MTGIKFNLIRMKPVVSIFLIALTALLISAIPDTLGFQNHQANHPLLGLTRHNIHDLVDEVDSIVARKQYSRLYALEDRFKLAAKIVPDSLRSAFRGACMWYANKLVTTTGDYPTALTYYLLAHHQVTDSICLDAYSWYIENEISTIYTRLGDYEKSEVYAWMVVRSLQCHHQWKELARYYSNIGINQQSLGNLDDARKTFLEGLRLADSMQYKAGIFSNCLGLGELFIQEMKWEEAEPYLSRARKVLPDISLSDRRLEKESGLYAAEAKIRQVQGNFLGSAALYIAAIQSLRQYYENTTRREFAKLYAALASCYLKTDSLDQALTAMRQGFHSLVPALGEGFVKADTNFLYPENTF